MLGQQDLSFVAADKMLSLRAPVIFSYHLGSAVCTDPGPRQLVKFAVDEGQARLEEGGWEGFDIVHLSIPSYSLMIKLYKLLLSKTPTK